MNEDGLIEFLMDHREYFKEKYSSLFSKRDSLKQSESNLFHDDIESEFRQNIISRMSLEIGQSTGTDMETIMIVLEEMDFGEYFK
jgi:hypothetical protein